MKETNKMNVFFKFTPMMPSGIKKNQIGGRTDGERQSKDFVSVSGAQHCQFWLSNPVQDDKHTFVSRREATKKDKSKMGGQESNWFGSMSVERRSALSRQALSLEAGPCLRERAFWPILERVFTFCLVAVLAVSQRCLWLRKRTHLIAPDRFYHHYGC